MCAYKWGITAHVCVCVCVCRYQTRMQTYSDQVKVLYREYAVKLGSWKSEKQILDRKVRIDTHTHTHTDRHADTNTGSTGHPTKATYTHKLFLSGLLVTCARYIWCASLSHMCTLHLVCLVFVCMYVCICVPSDQEAPGGL
jgi:hypothetical protein